jgi:hypothetical protein
MLNQAGNLVNDVIDVEGNFLSGCLVHERADGLEPFVGA